MTLVYYITLFADYKFRNRLHQASDIGVPNESAWDCKNSGFSAICVKNIEENIRNPCAVKSQSDIIGCSLPYYSV